MSDRTLLQDLEWFASKNFPPDYGYKPLLIRAKAEIERLRSLQTSIICVDCRKIIEWYGEWFRCFDCGAHLCTTCTRKHFGGRMSRHHRKMEEYEETIRQLKAKSPRE